MRHCDLFIICFIVYIILISGANGEDDEVDDEFPFTYDGHANKGPRYWGTLKPEWRTCATGKLQSPIDLVNNRVTTSPALDLLKRTYKPTWATIKSRGHDIMVEWHEDAGGIKINGSEYKLRQCHWHSPSEHTVNGKRYKLEAHMVHHDSHGQIAAIGILYKLGRPDPFLNMLLHHIKNINHESTNVGIIDPWNIKFGSRKYYRYIGSLTVPPCTEGVLWTILKKVRTASLEQIRALREAVHDGFASNARPVQRINDRSVHLFRPVE